MDNFLKTKEGFEITCKIIETINQSTDDYLFIWDIKADSRWFFGDIDQFYHVRKNGSQTNSTREMMKIIYPADRKAVRASLQEIVEGKKDTHDMNYRWINRDGQKVWINSHGTVIRDEENKPHLMIGRVSEEKLRHLFNPLTGLWNKNKLRKDLKETLKRGKGYLMLMDIDSLAAINLSRGRQYGDGLLKEVAELCEDQKLIKNAYHIDHNYFALILKTKIADEVREVYEAIKRAMQGKCTLTASAVPVDKALFYDETQLMDSVHMTMKKAKAISEDRIEFFSKEELRKKITALALLEEMKQSVENGYEGFEVYYQPQVWTGSYTLYGVEALLRYNSKTRGKVLPNEFIPILEQSRLIKKVGLWVLRQAAAQCKKWRATIPDLRISVNVSALQFEDVYLGEKIIEALKNIDLEGAALTVEITESIELHNSEQMENTIKQLRAYDIRFAIDDFGTGYSNLGYLKQLNVDKIKIDRVFVTDIEPDTYNFKLIGNVIEFARSNDIRVCCEGVETTRELAVLELLQPDVLQGYLFDKPNTAQMIEEAYLDPAAQAYQNRLEFLRKLFELKKQMEA